MINVLMAFQSYAGHREISGGGHVAIINIIPVNVSAAGQHQMVTRVFLTSSQMSSILDCGKISQREREVIQGAYNALQAVIK